MIILIIIIIYIFHIFSIVSIVNFEQVNVREALLEIKNKCKV